MKRRNTSKQNKFFDDFRIRLHPAQKFSQVRWQLSLSLFAIAFSVRGVSLYNVAITDAAAFVTRSISPSATARITLISINM
ncbi:hypothetical protein A4308_12360 [Enterobacter sp. ODB01]|nr:hypothetical protein A4308_12360 [Enterobacter sp. ODB01]VAL43473.1 Uncharacterised protein [Enterobacter kobei]